MPVPPELSHHRREQALWPAAVTAFAEHRPKPLKEFGAGEGIRTLDPNLGKVVLYP